MILSNYQFFSKALNHIFIMTKRKNKYSVEKKVSSLRVITGDVSGHPICLHGPTLMFSDDSGKFYACSSSRDNKDCNIRITEEQWKSEYVKKRNEKYTKLLKKVEYVSSYNDYLKVKAADPSLRNYCFDCKSLCISNPNKTNHKACRVMKSLSEEQIATPSTWLPPVQNNAMEAQYHFSTKALDTIISIIEANKFSHILCLGTPRIHETLLQHNKSIKSLLLDIDQRYYSFYNSQQFLWYNMFNHYFFGGDEAEDAFRDFLRGARTGGLCIVLDPPFGGRVEPLAYTLRLISKEYYTIRKCKDNNALLPVMWAFPYFSEPHIINILPEVVMCDYKIEYENHKVFQKRNNNAEISPVRLFTNLPPESIVLPPEDGYKYCNPCDKWVSVLNKHCDKCKSCTTKTGAPYVHCDACQRCVKPTFFHCQRCKRCCQQSSHVCGFVVPDKVCYNCNEKGHKRLECPKLQHDSQNITKPKAKKIKKQ